MAPIFHNLSDPIFYYAKERPESIAIYEGENSIGYLRFAGLVGRAAVHLRDLGVRPGELVGVSLPTTLAHVVLLFALLRIGAIPVDVPLRRPSQIDPYKRFGVKRVITLPGVEVAPDIVTHRIDAEWKAAIETKNGDYRHPGPSDNNLLFSVTSGSTGLPKGVVTTQREWWERYRSAAALLPEILDADRPPNLLVLGEISFSGFFFFIANQICIGGPMVLIGLVESVDALIEAINKWDDAAFLITPPMCREMLAKAAGEGPLLPKVRAMVVGAAPLYPEEKEQIRDRLTPNLYEVYGNAATGFITALPPKELAQRSATVGRVAPGVAVEIVDGRGRLAPPGAIGFVRIRGSGVSQRFLNPGPAPDAGPEGLRNGSYYPGDIGALDAAGFLHLKGRVSDLIKRGAGSVFPPEIEAALASHPSVAEAAVVGVPTKGGDPIIVGVVVPRGEADLEAVAQHCRERLPPEKLPNQLFWIEALPKTGPGKVDKPTLRASLIGRLQAATAAAGNA